MDGILVDAFRRPFQTPPFRGEIYDYAKKINLQKGYAIKGLFDVERSRYLIDVFKSLRDPRIREEVDVKAVQTAGSLTSDLSIPFRFENDPGDQLVLMQDDDFAKDYCKTRLMRLLESIPEIEDALKDLVRDSATNTKIILPGMTLLVGGLNEGNCQGLSWRYVTVDEGWRAKPGLIGQARARTTAYPFTSKFHLISQAGVEDDDLDVSWKKTNMKEWCWRCPGCGKLQPYYWQERRDDNSWCGILWDENERTRPDGKWNMAQLLLTVRGACKYCSYLWTDDPTTRRRLDQSGEYIVTNPNALSELSGHHWNAMANFTIPIARLVEQYLSAKTQYDDHAYIIPLKEFYQKRLAQAWALNRDTSAVNLRSEPYDALAAWPEEAFRFMTVDCQKDFTLFYIVIRAWSLTGKSRQIYRGTAESFDHVASLQKEHNVADQRVFVDLGYEQTRVARECAARGHWATVKGMTTWLCWNGLKGSDLEIFEHKVPRIDAKGLPVRRNGKVEYRTVTRIYSPREFLDPNIGTNSRLQPVPYWVWSNLHCKDMLFRHRDGRAAQWDCLPDEEPKENKESFTNQMHSEICMREKDPKTGRKKRRYIPVSARRANHFLDCEAMHFVPAMLTSCVGGAEPVEASDDLEMLAGDNADKEKKDCPN